MVPLVHLCVLAPVENASQHLRLQFDLASNPSIRQIQTPNTLPIPICSCGQKASFAPTHPI
jgi:hypothetical protein